MNISATSTKTKETTQQAETIKTETAKKAEETKATEAQKETAAKKEETKNEESDFQKLLETQNKEKEKNEEQIQLQQQQNPNQMNNITNIDANYVSKFGFDVATSNAKNSLSLNFDTATISKDDAKFFADLVDNKQFAVQENGTKTSLIKFADEIGPTYKAQQTSKVLTNLIDKAYKTGQPVRLDFDNNVSVIMKIDKKGKISAEFIPGDKAVEEYLRNNIRSLKQRFDDESIQYNDIFYRQSRNPNQQNQQKNKGKHNE